MGKEENMDTVFSFCGVFRQRPRWLKNMLTYRGFLLLYMILSSTQTTILSYLTVVLSTVEKEFGLKSKEAAWIYSGNEISQVLFVVFLPFVGTTKRKPFFIGLAAIISAIGMFLIAVPHFAGRGKSHQLGAFHSESSDASQSCSISRQSGDECNDNTSKDWLSISIVFIGILFIGIGNACMISLGTPFLDDNTNKRNSPMALSFGFAARVAGPAIGYIIGYFCLKVFVRPGNQPEGIDEDSPAWVGAWWEGCVIVGAFLILIAPLMMLFPSSFPVTKDETKHEHADENSAKALDPALTYAGFWKETRDTGKRLCSNTIYILHILATNFLLIAVVGFATFLPKYFEYMFRKRASTSIVGPATKSIAAVIGLLSMGAIVTKWQPRARILIASSIFSTLVGIASFSVLTQIGCPPLKFYGIHTSGTESITFSNLKCNQNTGCSSEEYQPICSVDGETHFFSPCQAGCQECEKKSLGSKNLTLYTKCSCVSANAEETSKSITDNWPKVWPARENLQPPTISASSLENIHEAYAGYCPSTCQKQYYLVLGVFAFLGLILSANRLPALLVFMRAVDPKDKTTAFTFTVSFLSLFALIPGPLIYGAIFDSTCTVWGSKCGEQLNCFAYDTDLLRVRVGSCSAILCAIAMICEFGIFYLGKDLKIYDDDNERTKGNFEENHTTISSNYTVNSEMELT